MNRSAAKLVSRALAVGISTALLSALLVVANALVGFGSPALAQPTCLDLAGDWTATAAIHGSCCLLGSCTQLPPGGSGILTLTQSGCDVCTQALANVSECGTVTSDTLQLGGRWVICANGTEISNHFSVQGPASATEFHLTGSGIAQCEVQGYTATCTASSISIDGMRSSPLQITTTSLPNACGQSYSTTLATSGGSGTGYTWSLSSGSLPDGFTLSPAGVLSSTGSPLAPVDSYSFTVQVTDSAGNLATQPFTLVIQPPLNVTPTVRGISLDSPTGSAMYAEASSPTGLTILAAAAACNFISFEWQQTIWNLPCPSGIFPVNRNNILPQNLCPDGSITATAANTLSDPPNGGTTKKPGTNPGYNPFPYYYPLTEVLTAENSPGSLCNATSKICLVTADGKLTFYDVPSGPWDNTPASSNPPANSFKGFTTTLVGVDQQGNRTPLYSWTWNSTFNGSAGGLTLLDDNGLNQDPPDPGSGTGGITIISINGVPVPTCVGDCDASGSVTVNEIITLVNMALGSQTQLSACPNGLPADITDPSQVDVSLIIKAVNNALNGCGGG
jgi:hypothetical protein